MSKDSKLKLSTEGEGWVDHKGDAYLPAEPLVKALNAALLLKRPILLMGEPGSGKTRLAGAVANQLQWDFKQWYVKSTQSAKDGLYHYDLVGRLRDSQLLANNAVSDQKEREELLQKTPKDYIRFNPLGQAILAQEKTVLLIDEIDKADRDFPNDLLLELDEKRFFVEELNESYESDNDLLIIITSNNERELPEPFLRRCIFFFIEFPKRELLARILSHHIPSYSTEAIDLIIGRFQELRSQMVRDRERGEEVKAPSTSELIDWVKVLREHGEDETLKMLNGKIPYAEVLVKRWEDHKKYIESDFV